MGLEFNDDDERSITFPLKGEDVHLRGMTWDELDEWSTSYHKMISTFQKESAEIEEKVGSAAIEAIEGVEGADLVKRAIKAATSTMDDPKVVEAYQKAQRKANQATMKLAVIIISTLSGEDVDAKDLPAWVGAPWVSNGRESFVKRALDHTSMGPKALSVTEPASTVTQRVSEMLSRRSGSSITSSSQPEE